VTRQLQGENCAKHRHAHTFLPWGMTWQGRATRKAPVRTEPHPTCCPPGFPGRAFWANADTPHADTPTRFPLQSKVCQAWMIQWARERSIPMKFAFGFFDWQIVNGGVPMMH
jgi:hypothetical protein